MNLETKKLIFSVWRYCICTPTISVQVAGVSYVLGSVQRLVTNWRFVHHRERKLLQDQVQLGIGVKVQL